MCFFIVRQHDVFRFFFFFSSLSHELVVGVFTQKNKKLFFRSVLSNHQTITRALSVRLSPFADAFSIILFQTELFVCSVFSFYSTCVRVCVCLYIRIIRILNFRFSSDRTCGIEVARARVSRYSYLFMLVAFWCPLTLTVRRRIGRSVDHTDDSVIAKKPLAPSR